MTHKLHINLITMVPKLKKELKKELKCKYEE